MKFEQPTQSRLIFFQIGDSKSIRVPVTKKWFTLVFLGVWLTGWTLGGLFAIGALFFGALDPFTMLFMVAWLTGWAVGWYFAARSWIWGMFGNTTLTIGKGALSIGVHVLSWNRFKHYKLDEIRGLAWEETRMGDKKNRSLEWDFGKGRMEFRHGDEKKVAIKGVSEDEGLAIIEALNSAAAPHDLTGNE